MHSDFEKAKKQNKIFKNQIDNFEKKIKVLQDEIFFLTLSKNDLQKDNDEFKKKCQNLESIFKENESFKKENEFLKKKNDELKSYFLKISKEKKIKYSLGFQKSSCIRHKSSCDGPSTSSCINTFTISKHDRA